MYFCRALYTGNHSVIRKVKGIIWISYFKGSNSAFFALLATTVEVFTVTIAFI